MTRGLVLSLALAASWLLPEASWAASRNQIISQSVAHAHGLTRAWMVQLDLNPARSRLRTLVLYDGVLFAQTDRGALGAYDAETGRPIWDSVKQIGNPDYPTMRPGVCGNVVAVVNGSRLFLLNRWTGDVLLEKVVDGVVGAGAAVSEQRVYVPMVNGMVASYQLKPWTDAVAEKARLDAKAAGKEDPTLPTTPKDFRLDQKLPAPLTCYASGRSLVQPIVTRQNENEEYVVWPTDLGFLMVAGVDRPRQEKFTLRYRLKTDTEMVGQPAYLPADPQVKDDSGIILGVSRDGTVHAIQEKSGHYLWRFPIGEPVVEPAVVVDDRVYVEAQLGGLFCLDVKTGTQQWWAPSVTQAISASEHRLYVLDRVRQMLILDRATGGRLDAMDVSAYPLHLLNMQTDRIYLASQAGLIQCLHEESLDKPIEHNGNRRAAPAQAEPAAEAKPEAGAKPEPEAKPET